MAGKGTVSTKKQKSAATKVELKATWTQDFTDFTIVLASGQELKCHKVTLAQNSSVFATMLKSELAEGKTNRMKLDHFDDATVFHFLEYIYASLQHIQVKVSVGGCIHTGGSTTTEDFHQRIFQKEKFTIELFKMAHMYNVEDLQTDCAKYLKTTITGANIVEIWREASKCDNEVLCEAVVLHLKSPFTSNKKVLEFLKAKNT